MATTVPKVEYRHNVTTGRHEVGVKLDGYFVPFASLDDAVVGQRVETASNTESPVDDTDDEGGKS